MSLTCPSCDDIPDASAMLGSPCMSCGAQLVRSDRVRSDRVRHAAAPPTSSGPTPLDLDLGALGDLQLVDLAERTDAPLPAPAVPLVAPTPTQQPKATEQLHPDIVNLAASDEKLELEGGWAHEKAARVAGKQQLSTVAARVVAEERARRRSGTNAGGLWIALVLITALGAGTAYFLLRGDGSSAAEPSPARPTADKPVDKPTDKPIDKPADKPIDKPRPQSTPATSVPIRGVAIRIVGANGTPITIDGSPAGKTPLSLKKSTTTTPIEIGANGKKWTVIPDRDQTIDITAP